MVAIWCRDAGAIALFIHCLPLQGLFNKNTAPMASVEFGGGVSQIVGRVAGSVFQRGRSGSQLRVLPINTGRKQNLVSPARVSLASVSSLWRSLSDPQRLAWVALANTQTRYNRMGTAYTPSGFQLFCELNFNLLSTGVATPIQSAPATLSLPSYTAISVVIDTNSSDYTITGTIGGDTTDFVYVIEATRPVGAGVLSNRSAFCVLDRHDDASSDPTNMWGYYFRRMGFYPRGGQVVYTRISTVHVSSGWRTPTQVIRTVVS